MHSGRVLSGRSADATNLLHLHLLHQMDEHPSFLQQSRLRHSITSQITFSSKQSYDHLYSESRYLSLPSPHHPHEHLIQADTTTENRTQTPRPHYETTTCQGLAATEGKREAKNPN